MVALAHRFRGKPSRPKSHRGRGVPPASGRIFRPGHLRLPKARASWPAGPPKSQPKTKDFAFATATGFRRSSRRARPFRVRYSRRFLAMYSRNQLSEGGSFRIKDCVLRFDSRAKHRTAIAPENFEKARREPGHQDCPGNPAVARSSPPHALIRTATPALDSATVCSSRPVLREWMRIIVKARKYSISMATLREFKCEICGTVTENPVHWFIIECGDQKLSVHKWTLDAANGADARHFCGEGHAQVFISRWFDSVCVPLKRG